ncbi:MAG: hypothetical protein CSA11_07715 [Chloroflexi bacterium]|nr:MAG: hypothetical protein CSB13_08000 [Chloroflexota bacterium]PIE80479.1 MAG: hypothetical protein CSA11_07715 [Chloroflexota bacterium]
MQTGALNLFTKFLGAPSSGSAAVLQFFNSFLTYFYTYKTFHLYFADILAVSKTNGAANMWRVVSDGAHVGWLPAVGYLPLKNKGTTFLSLVRRLLCQDGI